MLPADEAGELVMLRGSALASSRVVCFENLELVHPPVGIQDILSTAGDPLLLIDFNNP